MSFEGIDTLEVSTPIYLVNWSRPYSCGALILQARTPLRELGSGHARLTTNTLLWPSSTSRFIRAIAMARDDIDNKRPPLGRVRYRASLFRFDIIYIERFQVTSHLRRSFETCGKLKPVALYCT